MEIVQCEEKEYIVIEAGSSFLLNAGICGFIKMLDHADAEEGEDYIIEKQQLKVKKEFFLQNDLADLYVKTMVKKLGKQTKYHTILGKKNDVERLVEKAEKEELTKEDLKKLSEKLKELYKEMVDMLEKNSFLSGYEIIQQMTDVIPITTDKIKELKKSKIEEEKYQIYSEICGLLEQKKVKEVLIMKELMYSKINLFYDNISFFLNTNLKKNITECYRTDFIIPLLEEIQNEKKGKKRCIECLNYASKVRASSFMFQTTDDVNRKKTHYWNQKADAYICPLCAFLYTLTPLGFQFCGRAAVFINENGNISNMVRMMDAFDYKKEELEDKASLKSKIFRTFTTEAMKMTEKTLDNMQVIVRMGGKDCYEMSVISPEIVRGFQKVHKFKEENKKEKDDFEILEKRYIKTEKDYISIYDKVLECILEKRHLYSLMDQLFFYEMKENKSTDYIWNILKLEIYFKGGEEKQMDTLYELARRARYYGNNMRNELTKGIAEKDKENVLRGFVYKLNNAVSTRDLDMFIDTIIRVYSSNGFSIPSVILECYKDDTTFQTVARGYILGLKSSFDPKEKEDAKEEKQNTEKEKEKNE